MPKPKTWMSEGDNMPTKPTYTLPLLTPIPWTHTNASGKYRGAVWIKSNGKFIGKTYNHEGEDAIANAAFIIRAVNSFEKERAERYRLLHQLKKVTHQLKMRSNRTEAENNAIATADKAIAKAEQK